MKLWMIKSSPIGVSRGASRNGDEEDDMEYEI